MAKGSQEGGNSKITTQRYLNRIDGDGKSCNKCNKVKPSNKYGANKSWCLDCLNKYQSERRKKQSYKLW